MVDHVAIMLFVKKGVPKILVKNNESVVIKYYDYDMWDPNIFAHGGL